MMSDLAARIAACAHIPVPIELSHSVARGGAGGIYQRACIMPKNTIVVGRRYRHEGTFQVLTGGMIVVDHNARSVEIIQAGMFGVTRARTERVLIGLDDCTFVAQYPIPSRLAHEYHRDAVSAQRVARQLETYIYEPTPPAPLDWVTGEINPLIQWQEFGHP